MEQQSDNLKQLFCLNEAATPRGCGARVHVVTSH